MNFAKWIIAAYLGIQILYGWAKAAEDDDSTVAVGATIGVSVINGALLYLLIAHA